MQNYLGVKYIKAEPMKLGAYNEYRGWTIPESEDPEKEGYLVEYPIIGDEKPNHPNHEGYISWSPKAAFEVSYLPVGLEGTLGMNRVRHSFNPSKFGSVDKAKLFGAALIDFVEVQSHKDKRLAAISQTKIEDAVHWIVKLLTA